MKLLQLIQLILINTYIYHTPITTTLNSQVKESLVNADNLYSSWKRIRQTVKSANNQELLWTAEELTSCLDAMEQDLDDLDEALLAAKANPQQFHLSTQVLNTRQQFIAQSRNTIQSIRNAMVNPPSKHQDYSTVRKRGASLRVCVLTLRVYLGFLSGQLW